MSTDEVPVDEIGGKPVYRFRKRDKFRFYANKLIRQVCEKIQSENISIKAAIF